ncbi:hypothetical protein [Candidatus Leptofilum sp.]|uniref:hypothetical protein n=1 Tax=Candidatus Leptofilum sp. TaxID=3241576 RepID=UPI003B58DD5C
MSATLGIQTQTVVTDLWQAIEAHLTQEKQRIFDEIVNYPPPIPACDVQFNFLLAERAEILQALRQLHGILGAEQSVADQARAMHSFVESCQFFDDALQASLLAKLEGVLDEQCSL